MAYDQLSTLTGAERKIVLLTDGEPTEGNAMRAADRVKQAGIELNIIGIGGTPEDVNERLLRQMASRVNGQLRYWFIRDVPELVKRFEALALRAF